MTISLPVASKSLVVKHLSKDVLKTLELKETNSGFTLEKAIQSCMANPDSAIGIYAGDAESYQTFAPLFDPIIQEYHNSPKGKKQFHDLQAVDLCDPDPEKRFIISSRIRVARNLQGFNFTNHIDLASRKHLEKRIIGALVQLPGELKGEYHSFSSLHEEEVQELRKQKLFFGKGDRFQDAAGFNTDFPQCRGIFYSHDKQFRVWVNEEDHLRIISQETSSNLSAVFTRLCRALAALETHFLFEKNERYGYLTSCPTNIGTTMRAGVHIQLEKLDKNRAILTAITEKHDLQIRGTLGEKTEIENGIFDISNRQRLGISESEIVKKLHSGLLDIINAEQKL